LASVPASNPGSLEALLELDARARAAAALQIGQLAA
jgi:hypothetical protein